ncbi:MAG: MopE-related protein, partial [Pseudomonadota bacterium]
PGATELCNGTDDDCDGTTDEDDAADALIWYADADGDTYGDAASATEACTLPSGHVADATDCDDTNAAVNPGATEVCNGTDDDCDGTTDEDDAADALTWYADADSDGYGDAASTTLACTLPAGYLADDTDCDDTDAAVNPGATEQCNGTDDDCDGTTDEDDSADALTWYADADGDTYGDATSTTVACYLPTGYLADDTDCDDTDAAVNPGATELCNGVDDDCDGTTDEAAAADALTWYADADSDSYGDAASTTVACTQPSGYLADDTDCDDTDAAINPAATEVCDGADNDCDGTTDEADAADALTWYLDADSDGYGDSASTTPACSLPSGYADNAWDCDDTDPLEPVFVDIATGSTAGDGSLSNPYAAIQDGIDASSACVLVLPGTYDENIDFNGNDIEVIGLYGAELTIIDGGASGSVVSVDSGETTAVLQGFTITNGDASYGGGVYVDNADLALLDLIVEANVADYYGAGVYVSYGAAVLDNVRVLDNVGYLGVGVVGWEYSDLVVQNSVIAGNTASWACGGLGSFYYSTATLDNVLVADNDGGTYGGGVGIEISVDLTITNSVIVDNIASYGGGLVLSSSTDTVLENSVLAWNFGTSSADGVYFFSTSSTTLSCAYDDLLDDFGSTTVPVGSDGNIGDFPFFLDTSSADPLDWDLHLDDRSTLIDAGDPARLDPDGSTSDIGLYGGAGAEYFDLDGDGYFEWWQPDAYDSATYPALGWDCDDQDASVYPGSGC